MVQSPAQVLRQVGTDPRVEHAAHPHVLAPELRSIPSLETFGERIPEEDDRIRLGVDCRVDLLEPLLGQGVLARFGRGHLVTGKVATGKRWLGPALWSRLTPEWAAQTQGSQGGYKQQPP